MSCRRLIFTLSLIVSDIRQFLPLRRHFTQQTNTKKNFLPPASHHITSHHITSHHITSHHITSHHITSHHITSHRITPHRTASHHITSHHTASHRITSHHITLHHITPHRIASNHITSHHTTPHHTTPRHITSRHTTSRQVTSQHNTTQHNTTQHITLQLPFQTLHYNQSQPQVPPTAAVLSSPLCIISAVLRNNLHIKAVSTGRQAPEAWRLCQKTNFVSAVAEHLCAESTVFDVLFLCLLGWKFCSKFLLLPYMFYCST